VGEQENGIEGIPMVEVKAFLLEAYKQNKRLPSIKTMAEQFQVSEYKMLEVFRILVHEGFLKRNYSRYKMPDGGPVDGLEPEGQEEEPAPPPEPEAIEVKKPKEATWVLTTMRLILGVIGLGAIGVSIYYTSVWLLEYIPPFLAIFLASIMVIFSTMAFEVVMLLIGAKRWLMAAGFTILFITVLAFSMMSTIAGQYNQRVKTENVTVVADSATTQARAGYDLLVKQEGQISDQIKAQQSMRVVYQRLFDSYDTERKEADPKGFSDTKAQLDKIDKALGMLNTQLLTKQAAEAKYLAEAKGPGAIQETTTNTASFFVWAAKLFKNKIQADMLQFYFSVFPAVFVDLIAPFALAFALFQRKESSEKKRTKFTALFRRRSNKSA
jgi:hypothetical protein